MAKNLNATELINLGVKHYFEKDNGVHYFGVNSLKSKYSGLSIKDVDTVNKQIGEKEIKCIALSDVDDSNVELK